MENANAYSILLVDTMREGIFGSVALWEIKCELKLISHRLTLLPNMIVLTYSHKELKQYRAYVPKEVTAKVQKFGIVVKLLPGMNLPVKQALEQSSRS